MDRPRILLASHKRENQLITRRILEKAGYAVDIADNGRQAVDMASSAPYDLLIMDIELPEMDGLAAAIQIRHSLRAKDLPIIALGSITDEALVRQCLSAGMNEFLPMPLDEQTLAACIDRWVSRPAVLIVDDMQDSRRLLEHFLEDAPWRAVFAKNGVEAIAAFKREEGISLILMDMEMPVMDGYTAARTIASLMGQNTIPIIAMTAHEGEAEIAKCRKAGCTGHISKPVTRERLLHTLSTHLQASAPAPGHAPRGPEERPVVHIDPALTELVPRFLDNRRKDAAEIVRLLTGNDLDAIRIIGHSMAGSSGGYGFPEIGTIGKAIENAALSADHAKIKELAEQLSEYLSRVIVVAEKG